MSSTVNRVSTTPEANTGISVTTKARTWKLFMGYSGQYFFFTLAIFELLADEVNFLMIALYLSLAIASHVFAKKNTTVNGKNTRYHVSGVVQQAFHDYRTGGPYPQSQVNMFLEGVDNHICVLVRGTDDHVNIDDYVGNRVTMTGSVPGNGLENEKVYFTELVSIEAL